MFTFCPLQGALSESHASQSLLEFDGGIRLLIGVGWDESFDPDKLKEIEKYASDIHVPTLSLILLTHATVAHLAAYAHCCKTIPLFKRIPVYATRPVIDLGRTLLQDLYASSPAAATTVPQSSLSETATPSPTAHDFLLQAPTPDEIARYFSAVQALKYSQPHQPLGAPFSPPLNGLTITAYNAGHTLGGTIWHIQHGLESVVYAVDWNQARENVYAGAAWLGGGGGGGAEVIEQLRKPTALVCSGRGSDRSAQPGGRAKRDEQLVDTIRAGLGRGGTVLIPIDSSARVLEVAYLLEHAWRTDGGGGSGGGGDGGGGGGGGGESRPGLRSSKLYLAGRNVASTMRYARSMLEWMDDGIVREFEAVADGQRRGGGGGGGGSGDKRKEAGPFDFRHLRLLDRRAQIDRLLAREVGNAQADGRVIIASDSSLEWGFSKDIFRALARDSRNMVILTEKPGVGRDGEPSVARTLWDWWRERGEALSTEQGSNGDRLELLYGGGRELTLTDESRQPLEGEDLAAYQQWLTARQQLQATTAAGGGGEGALDASADAVDDASESSSSSSSSDESDAEQQGKALTVSAAMNQASRKSVVLTDEDLGVNIIMKKKGVFDFFCQGRKERDRAFPVVIRRRRMDDDYGEPLRHEDYTRAAEQQVQDDQAAAGGGGGGGKNDDDGKLGKKRRWGQANGRGWSGGGGGGGGGAHGRRAAANRFRTDDDAEMLGSTIGFVPDPEFDDLDDPAAAVAAAAEDSALAQGPCRLVVSRSTVRVNLRVGFVDFGGLHDRRSLHMLIPLIQPRKLILVAGGRDETTALAEDCRKLLDAAGTEGGDGTRKTTDVYAPEVGTWVDASVDTNAWILKLGEPLVRAVHWQMVKGLSVVTVSGQLLGPLAALTIREEEDLVDKSRKRQKTEEPEDGQGRAPSPSTALVRTTNAVTAPDDAASRPVLDVAPVNRLSSAIVRGVAQRPLHVGDVRLADLRRGLQSSGHVAEFRGEGTLLVDGTVSVRKGAAGRVEIEAWGWTPRREAFHEVRRMVYESLALVGGA